MNALHLIRNLLQEWILAAASAKVFRRKPAHNISDCFSRSKLTTLRLRVRRCIGIFTTWRAFCLKAKKKRGDEGTLVL